MSTSTSDTITQASQSTSAVIRIDGQTLPIIITLILLVFFFFGFLTIYFLRFLMEYFSSESRIFHRHRHITPNDTIGREVHGIDPSIISSFPTFEYSKVKDLREEKESALECAVCISEFQDDDILRLLTVCNHAFHPECIDLWLGSHTTCPVCRQDLLEPEANSSDKPGEVIVTIQDESETVENDLTDDTRNAAGTLRVSFKDEDVMRVDRNLDGSMSAYVESSGQEPVTERFSRSHSTGHSIVSGDHEKYTLRLPEHVKRRIAMGRNLTGSCTTFGDFSGDVTIEKNGLGEVSRISGVQPISVY